MCSSISSKPMRNARCAGGNEGRAHAFHVGFGDFARRVPVVAERDRRSRHGRPRIGVRRERTCALPRFLRRRLAAGMGDLDAEFGGAGAARRRDHTGERCFVVVRIEPKAAMGDAALALDMGCLDNHQSGAGIRQHAEMHQVPIIGAAVVGRILAHRRNDNAVGKLEAGQFIRRKKRAAHGWGYSGGRAGNDGTGAARVQT